MTDLNQLVEVGARALAKHPDSSWDDYEWEDMPSHVQMLFCEQSRAHLAAILPLLAEVLAGVAVGIGEQYGEDETGWFECSETIAQDIRTRIAAIMEGEGK